MLAISVQFPDGPHPVPAVCLGMNLLRAGGGKLTIPRVVPGYRMCRTASGWKAEPSS
jgi:hypothetical protein